jgi:hypothetical protein
MVEGIHFTSVTLPIGWLVRCLQGCAQVEYHALPFGPGWAGYSLIFELPVSHHGSDAQSRVWGEVQPMEGAFA